MANQAEILAQPNETVIVPMRITPDKRPLFGMHQRIHTLTATVTVEESEQSSRSLPGQLKSRPLVGPFVLTVIALCVAILSADLIIEGSLLDVITNLFEKIAALLR